MKGLRVLHHSIVRSGRPRREDRWEVLQDRESKPEVTVWVKWHGEEGVAQINYSETLGSRGNLQKDGVSHISGRVNSFICSRS